GILPFVGHGDDVGSAEVFPFAIALPSGWRARLSEVPDEPLAHIKAVKLLVPDHSGERLPLHSARVGIVNLFLQAAVEFVGFAGATADKIVEVVKWGSDGLFGQPKSDAPFAMPRDFIAIPRGCLGAALERINGVPLSLDQIVVKSVLPVAGNGCTVPDSR